MPVMQAQSQVHAVKFGPHAELVQKLPPPRSQDPSKQVPAKFVTHSESMSGHVPQVAGVGGAGAGVVATGAGVIGTGAGVGTAQSSSKSRPVGTLYA